MSKRSQSEEKFGKWDELPNRGRRYWLEVMGYHGWKARYIKEVDSKENTLQFYQEIYNERGELVEIHEKYPVDKGHQPLKGKK